MRLRRSSPLHFALPLSLSLCLGIPLAGCGPDSPEDEAVAIDPEFEADGKADGAGSSASVAAIQAAYKARDAKKYHSLLQAAIDELHHVPEKTVFARFQALVAATSKYDGLESLVLAHLDCMSTTTDVTVIRARKALARSVRQRVKFETAPAANLPQLVASCEGLVERAVDGRAVRAVVSRALQLPEDQLAGYGLARLLVSKGVRGDLCAMPLLSDTSGQIPLRELERRASCTATGTSGGPGSLADMCRALGQQPGGGTGTPGAPGTTGTATASGNPYAGSTPSTTGFAGRTGLSSADLDRLRELCDQMGGAGGATSPTGVGLDPLDGFSLVDCIQAEAAEVRDANSLVDEVEACMESMVDALGGGGNRSRVAGLADAYSDLAADRLKTVMAAGGVVCGALGGNKTCAKIFAISGGIIYTLNSMGLCTAPADKCAAAAAAANGAGGTSGGTGGTSGGTGGTSGGTGGTSGGMGGTSGGMGGTSGGMGGSSSGEGGSSSGSGGSGDGDAGTTPGGTGGTSGGGGDPGDGGTTLPGGEGGPRTAACDRLNQRLHDRGGRAFQRKPGGVDPRTANWAPDSDFGTSSSSCLSTLSGGLAPAPACNSLVMCVEGSSLDPATCSCRTGTSGGRGISTATACARVNCGEGTPVPQGPFGCSCESPSGGGGGLPGGPGGFGGAGGFSGGGRGGPTTGPTTGPTGPTLPGGGVIYDPSNPLGGGRRPPGP